MRLFVNGVGYVSGGGLLDLWQTRCGDIACVDILHMRIGLHKADIRDLDIPEYLPEYGGRSVSIDALIEANKSILDRNLQVIESAAIIPNMDLASGDKAKKMLRWHPGVEPLFVSGYFVLGSN